jgi:hypothetical protein
MVRSRARRLLCIMPEHKSDTFAIKMYGCVLNCSTTRALFEQCPSSLFFLLPLHFFSAAVSIYLSRESFRESQPRATPLLNLSSYFRLNSDFLGAVGSAVRESSRASGAHVTPPASKQKGKTPQPILKYRTPLYRRTGARSFVGFSRKTGAAR